MLKKILILNIILIAQALVFAQTDVQKYRNDALGNTQYRREGIMDGNLVRTLFYNDAQVAKWKFQPSGEWPKGSGNSYIDGVALLIATEILAPGNNQTVHPLETSYREWMDEDPVTATKWGLEPVPGYSNPSSEEPAMNTHTTSWPSVWPDALDLTPDWNGYWYGYFGRGVVNSDFETFFVMDDSKDGEFIRAPYSYIPIADHLDRGGLGLRVEVRGFQWSHVLAEDIIFWHYDIVNISDNNYPNTLFGFYTDCGVGGPDDSGDDCASFDIKNDIAYCYDGDGKGVPNNWITGYYGYAYLESPGNATDSLDNDQDGMLNERRDDGIDNDHDWISYSDLNGNGKWDAAENEPLNNDVGKDGVGPLDPQYLSADEGEGDGMPTLGEPNFDKTDKDESDQIGLTAVSLYKLGDGGVGGGWPKDDESMWLKMNTGTFDTTLQKANISMVFASGQFPLNTGTRERFSMALLFGSNLEDIEFNKETVQEIYNANYNFSKPPYKPTITAIAGDGKVVLYWDNVAEESRDPFLGFENNDPTQGFKKDFEGYLVYRSEEAEFNDIKIITDSKGDAKYWKPLAQYDLIDSIKGPDPIGINGARFWRGSNSGLQHSYVDTDVKNGQRYYYAIVSYDMGDPNYGTQGLQPSECTKIISEDYSGNVQFIDINCAVVTPNAPAAGYVAPQIVGDLNNVSNGIGTGKLSPLIVNPDQVKDGATYTVEFVSDTTVPLYKTTGYKVSRSYNGIDTTFFTYDSSMIGVNKYTPPFDGMSLQVLNDTSVVLIDSLTGWVKGTTNMMMFTQANGTSAAIPWPADYEIQFSGDVQDTSFIGTNGYTKFPVNFKIMNTTSGYQTKCAIKDMDSSKTLSPGDILDVLEFKGAQTLSNARIAWEVICFPILDPNASYIPPVAGDIYQIKTKKQFKTGDYFSFATKPVTTDAQKAAQELSKVDVVPNPYIGTNEWERRNLNSTGRGERRIDFINLPAQCTIRIYTMSGALVKTLAKDTPISNGAVSWDLVTDDGMEVAYGVYIYHVDAPGIGEHIGKFALIK